MKATVVGLGRVGYDFGLEAGRVQPASHFHCYTHLGMAVSVCDSDQTKLEHVLSNYPQGPGGSTDVDRTMKMFEPEIVSICTPTPTHAPLVKTVADYSSVKTIFLEKPIAQSLQEADEIIDVCKQKNIQLFVNYSRRWSRRYRRLKEQLTGSHSWLIGIHPGPLIRTGTHMIDLFNWFSDSAPQSCQTFGSTELAEYMKGTEDVNINGEINYGDTSAFLLGYLPVPQNAVVFELDIINNVFRVKITDNGNHEENFELAPSKRYTNLKEYAQGYVGGTYPLESPPENSLLNAITELTGVISKHACTGEDARRDLQVALALHYSATVRGGQSTSCGSIPRQYTVRSY